MQISKIVLNIENTKSTIGMLTQLIALDVKDMSDTDRVLMSDNIVEAAVISVVRDGLGLISKSDNIILSSEFEHIVKGQMWGTGFTILKDLIYKRVQAADTSLWEAERIFRVHRCSDTVMVYIILEHKE